MAKLQKIENAVETCPNCGQKMVCKSIPSGEGYPDKLQWQNDKGESHYLKPVKGVDGKMTFPCRPYTTEGQAPQTISPQSAIHLDPKIDFKREFVTDEQEQKWSDIVCKAAEYTILAQNTLSDYPIDNNALKGLVTKVAFKVLELQKAEEHG